MIDVDAKENFAIATRTIADVLLVQELCGQTKISLFSEAPTAIAQFTTHLQKQVRTSSLQVVRPLWLPKTCTSRTRIMGSQSGRSACAPRTRSPPLMLLETCSCDKKR